MFQVSQVIDIASSLHREMAVFARLFLWIVIAGCGLSSSTVRAESYASYRKCAHAARFGLKIMTGRFEPPWRDPCRTEVCRAERDVQCVFDAVARRDFPNTMAYPTRREADVAQRAFAARIEAFGHEHPGRIPLYCAALVQRTRRAVRDFANTDNQGMVEATTELAARLDRPERPCLEKVLALVPRTPEAAKLIDVFRGYCYAARPVCDRIRLPGAP